VRKTWKDVAVGDTVWIRDANIRHYHKPEPGQSTFSVGMIYRDQFKPVTVIAVEKLSIVTDYVMNKHRKINRTTGAVSGPGFGSHNGTLTASLDMESDVYINDNRHRIAHQVQDCDDADLLRAIQHLLDTHTQGAKL